MTQTKFEQDYRKRMARVVDAIVADPMAPHSLSVLADIAHFSPFHFHRIYRALLGETVAATIRRLRLARAAVLLGEGRCSVTQIALETGYDSPQAFTRAFRQFSGESPRAFQQKMRSLGEPSTAWPHGKEELPVQLLEREPLPVHALLHRGPAATIPHTHRRLRALVADRPIRQWLGLSYGDPEAEGDFRYYAAAALHDAMPAAAELEMVEIPGGTYASHTLLGPYAQINAAITRLYSGWLPHSSYEPDHRPVLEWYRNNPRSTPPEALHTDLLIPVRRIAI